MSGSPDRDPEPTMSTSVGHRTGFRPRIKICGVTNRRDALLAIDLGAELIGLNFYAKSPRFLDVERARALREQIAERAKVVGVFVNEPLERVHEIAERVGLDLLQFHGDESPEEIAHLAPRAIRALPSTVSAAEIDAWSGFWGLLFDTPRELLDGREQYGGSGRAWRYQELSEVLGRAPDQRILLAGGVRPANVRGILRELPGLWGLDLCSGVEAAPGRKDEAALRAFFSAVDAAVAVAVGHQA